MSNNIDKCIATPLVCAKLFAVLALAAHELAESLPGATVIERACLEAAYSDLKQSPIAAMRFRQNTSSSTSSVLRRETRKMETHIRRAAEEGYRRALVQSYQRSI
ncbi:Hypothetical protein, putative [Bodo saltans]|uniref:Membrane-associated protein n=1 Tax=Bodo saltans TaxID=75058 RepID=A0A0S4J8N8_BODSA|nr:Hypothetical protein, putative [Bodo saltans]|eukprot:CUG87774.1 Hypothetical protein, putative [Bodo saltans]